MASPTATSLQEKYFLLVIGDHDCKSKLMSGLTNGFPLSTELSHRLFRGSESDQLVEVDGTSVTVEVYRDSYFEPSSHSQYQRANGIMILYDVTDQHSLDDEFNYSMREIDRYKYFLEDTLPPIMLVGANIEKKGEQILSLESMRMSAHREGINLRFAEVSTVTGENVETALQTITRDIIAHCAPKPEPKLPKTKPKKKRCVIS